MTSQSVTRYQDDDTTWIYTFDANGSIAGDTYKYILSDMNNHLKLTRVSGAGITTTDAGSVSTPGIVTVDMVDQLELPATNYKWELRRTNSTHEKVIAFGILSLERSQRDDV